MAEKAAELRLAIEEGEKVLREADAATECTAELRLMDYFDILTENKLWPATSAFEARSLDQAIETLGELCYRNTHQHKCSLGRYLSRLRRVADRVEREIKNNHPQPSELRFEFDENWDLYL